MVGLNICMSSPCDPVPTFIWVFEYQPIALEILTQPSRYKRAESDLLADKTGPYHLGQVIHLYLYIYYSRAHYKLK